MDRGAESAIVSARSEGGDVCVLRQYGVITVSAAPTPPPPHSPTHCRGVVHGGGVELAPLICIQTTSQNCLSTIVLHLFVFNLFAYFICIPPPEGEVVGGRVWGGAERLKFRLIVV